MRFKELMDTKENELRIKAAFALGIAVLCATAVNAHAVITPYSLGDNTSEVVHSSWDGVSNSLTRVLARSTPAITGIDGHPLIVGDVSLGQDPATSDQLQYQRFMVTGEDAKLRITFLGTQSGYVLTFGVYTQAAGTGDPNSAEVFNSILTSTDLFTGRSTPEGSTVHFKVTAGEYFGFYVKTRGSGADRTTYYTENGRNSDGEAGSDHFLMFNTNHGILIAAEDLPYNRSTGLMGDQDYNDMLVGFLNYADGRPMFGMNTIEPIPNPESATISLVALAFSAAVVAILRRRQRDIHYYGLSRQGRE